MYVLKIITTVINVIMMSVIFFFMRSITWEKDKYSVIGFTGMQILYILNMICMWD